MVQAGLGQAVTTICCDTKQKTKSSIRINVRSTNFTPPHSALLAVVVDQDDSSSLSFRNYSEVKTNQNQHVV